VPAAPGITPPVQFAAVNQSPLMLCDQLALTATVTVSAHVKSWQNDNRSGFLTG
jgi:hypothetical protein